MIGLTIVVCLLHGGAIWIALEGWKGLTNGWPLWRDDHLIYYHSALISRAFLARSWTTAGYDPAFMSGYAKSVIFPSSSTLPELVVAAFGGSRPEFAYKLYVLVSAAIVPWLVGAAALIWRLGAGGTLAAVALYLIYVWTDFPIDYVSFGMLPYFLAIPLGLLATAAFTRYCEWGGLGWWFVSTMLMVLAVLVHFTVVMIVAPAVGLVYFASWRSGSFEKGRGEFPRLRHLGVWLIPAAVLLLNAFWWLPGIWLASTKGVSGFTFAHSNEGVLQRILQIATKGAYIERLLSVMGLFGIAGYLRRGSAAALGLMGFIAAGFGWGYLAGGFPSLDFLQPGRHTYAFFMGLSIATGWGISRWLRWVRGRSKMRLDVAGAFLLVLGIGWLVQPKLEWSVRYRVTSMIPFLSSRPSPRLAWVVNRVKQHVSRGERLLYEEGGFGLPGVPDPFQGGRFSGLLPEKLGVELIGGPYLHASLMTNFTQFGEGKLFERAKWDREQFVRYARLYRPSAILCWSPWARAFCRANPDLVEVRDENGALLIGRVKGFEGGTIEGKARVEAGPGWLKVVSEEGGVDGSIVLRYHSVPCLSTDRAVAWEPVFLEHDPVPFIKLLPPLGEVTFELKFPPRKVRGQGR